MNLFITLNVHIIDIKMSSANKRLKLEMTDAFFKLELVPKLGIVFFKKKEALYKS